MSNKNGLICMDGEGTEKLDLCDEYEICVGPSTPDNAQLFSRSIFCTKRKPTLTYEYNLWVKKVIF